MGSTVQLALTLVLVVPLAIADYVLYTGEVLLAGQNLTNGRYQLSMQPNCDLVLHESGNPMWRTSTADEGHDCYLALKSNGELVVRRNVHYTVWSSIGKSKKGKYALVLDPKGKIAVYGQRRWTSNNAKEKGKQDSSPVSTEYVLYTGQRLTDAKKLVYKDYELGLAQCNMAIKDTRLGKVLWQTSTGWETSTGKPKECYLSMESDGEFVLKQGGQRLWSSNRKGDSGAYVAALRFDGRVAVFGPLLWSNDSRRSDSPDVESSLRPKIMSSGIGYYGA